MHIMLDLETLGTAPGCKVLSIGAVVFSADGLGAEHYVELIREDQGNLTEDPDTLKWWMGQPAEVRDRLFEPSPEKTSLTESLTLFNQWLALLGPPSRICMWGNGADFDQPILLAGYRQAGIKHAWGTYNNRCYRTLKALAPELKMGGNRVGAKHNALDDAKSQALHAVQIFDKLKLPWA